ncbi:glycerophosphodiester phosphodiesterase family protein [Sporosarcina thermotolerans]|uniref:Glycerophosphodiester phosphodiesterase family protein n=1 Tax=Sporosarcina thermotolerans TaxID=633404 RepID=A0AAW9AF82_9BACL|nr:glycerophosphodiester phosphodiesterase family protein [Sporosarcina thermotolerans]MDW0117843.1 glycerophosphodiester phosphodiesterase family protein [Sporosarcina thermotolerans]WHT49349.1 glycerophosphodiester phosphodiesterase family protein [Sporosarcina thermotolerans]
MRKHNLVWIAIVGACLLLLVGYNGQTKRVHQPNMMSIAHRGASGFAPENTRSAFLKSVELQADYLECDVHLSKDGELIIMHDERIDRTTNGSGFISDYTLAELREFDAGITFSEEFKGESIMTLNELLDEFFDQIGLLIELKNPEKNPGIEESVVSLLSKYDDLSSIIVQSFDIESMRKMQSLLPELNVAVLVRPAESFLSDSKLDDLTSFASFVNFNVSFVNKSMVNKVQQRGSKVLVWSKSDKKLVSKAHKYGVDGIISDYPSWRISEQIYLVQE